MNVWLLLLMYGLLLFVIGIMFYNLITLIQQERRLHGGDVPTLASVARLIVQNSGKFVSF